MKHWWPAAFLGSCIPFFAQAGNPCLDDYPQRAGDVVVANGGRVAKIEPVEWLEDGVFRITTASGGTIMSRPLGLPMPPIGARLELRIYSVDKDAVPFGGCYCQVGTNLCVEEYSYP